MKVLALEISVLVGSAGSAARAGGGALAGAEAGATSSSEVVDSSGCPPGKFIIVGHICCCLRARLLRWPCDFPMTTA